MYDYRETTPGERREIVEHRRRQQRPWHSPPHWGFEGAFVDSRAKTDYGELRVNIEQGGSV